MRRRRFLTTAGLGLVGLSGTAVGAQEGGDRSTLIASWRGRDPTTRTTLQWVTDAPEDDVSVELAPETGDAHATDATGSPFGETGYRRYRAEFTDLRPDTRYRIAIDGTDTGSFVRTAPEDLSEPLTFAQGGDVGPGPIVTDLHGQAADWDPLFGLVGGDMAYADADPSNVDRWITFLEHWHEHMRSDDRLIPIAAAIGNHEVDGGMDGSPADAPFYYSLFDNAHRERAYWALDVGEDLSILVLDSNHTTPVPGDQTEWLEAALDERTERQHLMVAYHVPAYPSMRPIESRSRGDIREHWVPLFEEYGVDVAFEHDDHTYKRTYPLLNGEPDPEEGIPYVGDGAWGQGPREVADREYLDVAEEKLHVIRVRVDPDGSREFEAVDPNGETVDAFDGNGDSQN